MTTTAVASAGTTTSTDPSSTSPGKAGQGIRRAGTGDADLVGAIVAAGFQDDPTTVWLYPDPQRRAEVLPRAFALYASAYIPHGETYINATDTSIAMWLPPDAELLAPDQEESFGEAVLETMAEAVERVGMLEETFAKYHPAEPLWYLQFLATVPSFQGQGLGSMFLRRELARADQQGIPAYHEATTPRNRALYERHGYQTLGEFTLPDDGPPLWRMWREPR